MLIGAQKNANDRQMLLLSMQCILTGLHIYMLQQRQVEQNLVSAVGPAAAQLVLGLLHPKPSARLTAAHALQLPFFTTHMIDNFCASY